MLMSGLCTDVRLVTAMTGGWSNAVSVVHGYTL